MLAGDTRDLTAVDDYGDPVSGATWSSSDPNVASLDSGTATLTANNAGTATITATYSGLTAQATVTVYVADSLPAGTVIWSNGTPANYYPRRNIPATPTGTNLSDLFSVSSTGTSANPGEEDIVIHGTTVDGKRLWSVPITTRSASLLTPDRLGGLVVPTDSVYGQVNFSNLVQIDGNTGQQRWVYSDSNSNVNSYPLAIHPDGTIYTIGWRNLPANPRAPGGGGGSQAYVLALDGSTGKPKFTVDLPQSHDTLIYSSGYVSKDQTLAPDLGPMAVMPDGSVYLQTFTYNDWFLVGNCAPDCNGPARRQSSLDLVKIQSNGFSTKQNLKSWSFETAKTGPNDPYPPVWHPGSTIPDGQGGFVASWADTELPIPMAEAITEVKGSHNGGNEYHLPFPFLEANPTMSSADIILGENNMAFATDNVRVIGFNINSGPVWMSDQSGWTNLVAATDGGGLVITRDTDDGQEVVRFGVSGNPTTDTWTTAAASQLGAPAVGNIAHVVGDGFFASPSSGGSAYGGTHLIASSATIDWSKYNPWASVQDDRAPDPKLRLTLSVSNIYMNIPQDLQTNSAIVTKVNNARDFWWKKAKILFDWNGQVSAVKSCDPIAYPNGCAGNPQMDIAEITSANGATEFVRRLCDQSVPRIKCTEKGSQLVFVGGINYGGAAAGYTPFAPETATLCSGANFFNISAIASEAVEDGSSHDVSHEVGHQFQLFHPCVARPDNLMCGILFCIVPHAGGYLTPKQIEDARKGAAPFAE